MKRWVGILLTVLATAPALAAGKSSPRISPFTDYFQVNISSEIAPQISNQGWNGGIIGENYQCSYGQCSFNTADNDGSWDSGTIQVQIGASSGPNCVFVIADGALYFTPQIQSAQCYNGAYIANSSMGDPNSFINMQVSDKK